MTPVEPIGLGGRRTSRLVDVFELESHAAALLEDGFRLGLVAGHDDGDGLRVVYVFLAGQPDRRVEVQVRLDAKKPVLRSLGSRSFPASRFERELADLFGIELSGHPFPRPLVLHQHWPRNWHPMRRGAGKPPPMRLDAKPFPFVKVGGPGVYEIPVGPVHAGLIEPGHFRFSVVGETIIKMKARLWFVHRGVEELFQGKAPAEGVALAERISGDTAVGHNLAYCLAVEGALGIEMPQVAQLLRSLLLELERVTNHVADLGALCNDVGFGVAQARALILRERLLRLASEVTGHRLLRGAITPGEVLLHRLPTQDELNEIEQRLDELVSLATSNTVVMDRFRGTAVLRREDAEALGVTGVVARASGIPIDARVDHPIADLGPGFAPVVQEGGDVLARYLVRAQEARDSLRIISNLAGRAGSLAVRSQEGPRRPAGSGLGIVEGWRGTIVHRVEIGSAGCLTRCKVVDPSFLAWPALSTALADTIVPDFPLANKSFNLSYAGNDL